MNERAKITMNFKNAMKDLEGIASSLPKFDDGRINYTNSSKAVVVNVLLKFDSEILLLRRSDKVGSHKGLWNVLSGYFDEFKPVRDIARKELKEELGIENGYSLLVEEPYEFRNPKIKRTWLVFPVTARLFRKPEIKLNWENSEFAWIKFEDIGKFDTVPNLDKILKTALLP